MKNLAYYNENDPRAAEWLRQLIKHGVIAEGYVDERSIAEVQPADLAGFTQCHFFAGVGGWAYALRLAGWPDDRPVWTGSCPCQPFSAAGKGLGENDPRHLWPEWFRLIIKRRPVVIFGEQVASRAALSWLDTVQNDLEGEEYSLGAVDLCAAGVGAPHIRQRIYFVADTVHAERRPVGIDGENGRNRPDDGRAETLEHIGACGEVRSLADADANRFKSPPGRELHHAEHNPKSCGHSGAMADNESDGRRQGGGQLEKRPGFSDNGVMGDACGEGLAQRSRAENGLGAIRDQGQTIAAPGADGSAWRNAEWIMCTDGKARPIEPGSFPLAYGVPGRVGLLRGYGNAIVPQAAAAFVRAYIELLGIAA